MRSSYPEGPTFSIQMYSNHAQKYHFPKNIFQWKNFKIFLRFFSKKVFKKMWGDLFRNSYLRILIFFEILILEYWSVYQNLGQTRCGTGTRGAPAGTPGAPRWPETCATMDNVSKKMWHNIWDKICDKFEQDLNKRSDKIWDGYTRDTCNIWNLFLSVRVTRVPMSGCTCSRCAQSPGSIVFWGFYGRSDGFHGFRTDSTFAMSDFPRESTDSTDSISYNKKDILRYLFYFKIWNPWNPSVPSRKSIL